MQKLERCDSYPVYWKHSIKPCFGFLPCQSHFLHITAQNQVPQGRSLTSFIWMLVENVAFNYKSIPLKTVDNARMKP